MRREFGTHCISSYHAPPNLRLPSIVSPPPHSYIDLSGTKPQQSNFYSSSPPHLHYLSTNLQRHQLLRTTSAPLTCSPLSTVQSPSHRFRFSFSCTSALPSPRNRIRRSNDDVGRCGAFERSSPITRLLCKQSLTYSGITCFAGLKLLQRARAAGPGRPVMTRNFERSLSCRPFAPLPSKCGHPSSSKPIDWPYDSQTASRRSSR